MFKGLIKDTISTKRIIFVRTNTYFGNNFSILSAKEQLIFIY